MRIYLGLFLAFFACESYGQVRGSILDPATPAINPMDPNGDGYITSTGTAFSGPLDQTQFELPFLPLQQYEQEPANDNQYAPGCEFYELITNVSASVYPGYYYFQDPDGVADSGDELILFRFRLARFSNGATAFSILIDTDYRFGFEGLEADENAIKGNPGFEREVVVFNHTGSDGGVWVLNVDGTANPSLQGFHGSLNKYYQISYALNQDPNCTGRVPVFVDTYVPFSALGISSGTQIRMAVAADEDIDSSLGGGASDIGGVNGILMPDDDDQFVAVISNFTPIRVDQPANIAPLVEDAAVTVDENSANGLVVHTVAAHDANGDGVVFSLTEGNINNAFAVNSTTGALTINDNTVLDHETTPTIVLLVTVSDGSLYDHAVITINVNDVNDHPPALSDDNVELEENASSGTVVHTVVATDVDAQSALTYSIKGGSGVGIFNMDAQTGVITVSDPGSLDFETSPSFTLLIEVSDGLYVSDAEMVITLIDENEAPSLPDATLTLAENPAPGTLVHVLGGTDPDQGAELRYSLIGGDILNAFVVDYVTGEIKVNDASGLDFESNTSLSLNVVVSDGLLTDNAVIEINITNVNEAPVVTSASLILESFQETDIIHTVVASDPDAGDVLSYALDTVNPYDAFAIDAENGAIAIVDDAALPLVTTQFQLIVTVTDQGGLSAKGVIELTLVRPATEGIAPEKGFSPNGDSFNDFWLIRGIETFPDNHVKVFNRWGQLVYEVSGYDNGSRRWQGEVSGQRIALESTYFFIITAEPLRPVTGYVIVKP